MSAPEASRVDIVVPPGTPPMRVDQFIACHLAHASRRRLRKLAAQVAINGRVARRSDPVRPGDRVTVPRSLLHEPSIRAAPLTSMSVLYADDAMIAVDKPPGVGSVALGPDDGLTVAAFLVSAFPELRAASPRPLEAGLVHRLDRDTSGVILAARSRNAYAHLRAQFAAGSVRKEYLALVAGDLSEDGVVRTPIAHDPRSRKRMRPCAGSQSRAALRARPAETAYRPEVRYGSATLVRIAIHTGVRHQVRVHLASIGHPVVGDLLYGGVGRTRAPIRRQALHACRIDLAHPLTGAALTIDSPLPADFEAATRWYAAHRR